MSTQIVKVDLESNAVVPAYLQGMYTQVYENIGSGFSRNRISLKGNRFRLIVDNQEESIVETSYLDVIIVGLTKDISRIYFEGAYNADTKANPVCYSTNGKVPNEDVKVKQAEKCVLCPMNEKGSRIGADGSKFKACQSFQRLAVVLPNHLDRVFQLDCKATTLWAESRPNENKYNFDDYKTKLKIREKDPSWVITRLSFDTNVSYARLFFTHTIFVPQNIFSTIYELTKSDEVKNILEITASTMDYAAEVDKSDTSRNNETITVKTKDVAEQKQIVPKISAVNKSAIQKPEITRGVAAGSAAPSIVPKPTPVAEQDLESLLAQLGIPDDVSIE